MPASPFEGAVTAHALRIALAFAAALTVAEAIDLELTFIAPLTAAALAAGGGVPAAALVVLPLAAWLSMTLVAVLVEAFAGSAPLVYLVITVLGLWAGFALSTERRFAVFGLLTLIFFAIAPLRLMAYPEAADVAVDDIARNVLVGTVSAWLVAQVVRAPAAHAAQPALVAPVPPIGAALIATLGAYLVWIYEPPAPGAVLIGVLIALRADPSPVRTVARDRLVAALAGGAAAVAAATLVALAPVLVMLFLALLLLAWPFAASIAAAGPWRGAALKSLNAFAILTAEGFSPLFEDTEERLGIRLVGVVVGLLYASAALWLLAPRGRPVASPSVRHQAR